MDLSWRWRQGEWCALGKNSPKYAQVMGKLRRGRTCVGDHYSVRDTVIDCTVKGVWLLLLGLQATRLYFSEVKSIQFVFGGKRKWQCCSLARRRTVQSEVEVVGCMTWFYNFPFPKLMIWKEDSTWLYGIFLIRPVTHLYTIKLVVLYCDAEDTTF